METSLTTTTKKGKANELTALIDFTSEQVQLMKETVAKGATNNEFMLFMHLAKTYGLDPFAKEIWCLKYGSNQPATIFTSRDGYLKIASRDANMDGIQSDVVCENDTLDKTVAGLVAHAYGKPRGAIIGAYALVFRKDRSRPAYFYAAMAEYSTGNNPTWKKYPSAMIVKVAEAMALKRAFSISGLVTQEEIGLDAEPLQDMGTSAAVVVEAAPKATDEQKNEVRALLATPGLLGHPSREKTLSRLHGLTPEGAEKTLAFYKEWLHEIEGGDLEKVVDTERAEWDQPEK